MADDKEGRENQAQNAENRQRQREITEALERADETEPPVEADQLESVERDLDDIAFPTTGIDLVGAVGDRTVEASDDTYTLADLLPETDAERFESPAEVRTRVQRPRISAAMKRVVEAGESVSDDRIRDSQREAYEKTFRELKAIDADDDDEGIQVIADWIVEQVREKGKLPGSRGVRREAAKFCRKNGYSVRNDEWLGV